MFFLFGYVVTDVIDQIHPEVPGTESEQPLKRLTGPVHQHLPVGPRIVGRACHTGPVSFSHLRVDHCAGKLTVGNRKVKGLHVAGKDREEIITDLVSKPPGPGMEHHCDLSFPQTKGPRRLLIKDFIHNLHFQKVVAGAKCPQLFLAPFQGAITHHIRSSPFHASVIFGVLDIRLDAIAVFNRPPGALYEHLFFLGNGQFCLPGRTKP